MFLLFFIISYQPQGEMKMNLEVIGDIGANTKTELVKLENVKASEIEPFVSSRLTKYGSCQVNDPMNMLIITDYEPKLKDIIDFVKKIDKMGSKEFLKLKTLSIPVNYVLPSSIINALKSRLSPEGKIDSNDELGIIIVTDVESKIQDVMQVVLMLDTPPKQVLLRGKIIELSKRDAVKLGLDIFDVITSTAANAGIEYYKEYYDNIHLRGLGSARISLSELITKIEQKENMDLRNYIKEFSLIIINNNNGVIPLGENKYLFITPRIGYKGYINFYIGISGMTYYSREFSTNVGIYNGDTLVISGVNTKGKEEIETGIPLLKSIPLLGYIFKRKTAADIEKTLLIIIQPEIISMEGKK
uniref:Type II/III secretion system secretin-like domain-containing protein n=1 Tax=candidate division WOR-3 bacterium TaxID=2052148 RepID=A0A7C4UC05_UNCW3